MKYSSKRKQAPGNTEDDPVIHFFFKQSAPDCFVKHFKNLTAQTLTFFTRTLIIHQSYKMLVTHVGKKKFVSLGLSLKIAMKI
jgi:hypothetical protein